MNFRHDWGRENENLLTNPPSRSPPVASTWESVRPGVEGETGAAGSLGVAAPDVGWSRVEGAGWGSGLGGAAGFFGAGRAANRCSTRLASAAEPTCR